MGKKMKVLCVSDYFLPGFKGGGPIRTLDNMRKQISGSVTLSIFTRDRDLGSDTAYPGVEVNRWLDTPDGPVFYARPDAFGANGLKRALVEREADILYLNSFFGSGSSIRPYLALRRQASKLPILLAPRGEFSQGALAVKKTKKRAFLEVVRHLGLYRDVSWHASTELEARDILRQFPGSENRIHIAPDPIVVQLPHEDEDVVPKEAGHLRVAFISRISPMKNLDGLIKILETVRTSVDLDVFGPVEDEPYWRQCERKIAALPSNVRVTQHGPLAPEDVSPTFSRYDMFAFPTHGENFGHVIFEALRVGTPVVVSDQTPWRPDKAGALEVLPVGDKDGWRRAIEQAAERAPDEQASLRAATLDYAARYAATDGSLDATLSMFHAVLTSQKKHVLTKTPRSYR